MNWGHYITITLIVFVGIIISLVTISMKQDVSLVAPDYYKQEIEYQDQIDKATNFKILLNKPSFDLNLESKTMEISFPETMISNLRNGTIQLYRPSESSVDKLIDISLQKDGTQQISMKSMKTGLWKAKIYFSVKDKDYYFEKNVIL